MNPRAKRAGISFVAGLVLAVICLTSAAGQSPPTTQCVSTAVAGGTGDAITIPRLPCVPTTTLLTLVISAANTTTSPKLIPSGAPGLPLLGPSGGVLPPGALQPGFRALLTSNGQAWFVLNSPVPGPTGRGIVSPLDFGCIGDGVADDTACVQSAIAAAVAGKFGLSLDRLFAVNPGTLSNSGPLAITGTSMPAAPGGAYATACTTGLRYRSVGTMPLFQANAPVSLTRVCIDSGLVHNTSGVAISLVGGNDSGSIVRDSQVYGACIGIDVSGTATAQNAASVVDGNTLVPANAPGCAGIRHGVSTTQGNTPDTKITNNQIYCGNANAGQQQVGMLFLDGGGPFVSDNAIYACNIGTYIHPGINQSFQYGFFSNTILGDSDIVDDLLIDTADASAVITNLKFTGTWASTAFTGPTVLVRNSAGGRVDGLHFVNHQSLAFTLQRAIDLQAGSNVSFTGSLLCGGTGQTLVHVGAADRVSLVGNQIGSCTGGGPADVGVLMDGDHFDGVITNNDFVGATVPISYAVSNPSLSGLVLLNNLGIDNIQGVVTSSSATVTLPVNPMIRIDDATPIDTLNTVWGSRRVTMTAGAGGLSFITGGNIVNAVTATVGQLVYGEYVGGTGWRLK